ncbi:hypothetical protein AMJ57_04875 [Parcubacteria bacterium SG8_24]|nr:MAG: hypothetical protein AMJ57_04875 [Parcubacteria bacterium SG8_24]
MAAPPTDTLIKASSDAVYYHAADGKRYVFPNQKTYQSWFSDFSGVVTVTDTELASLPLGGNVTYRPGIRMIKIVSDPKVYAVARGGVLRWVSSETVARTLYGEAWNTLIDDVSDAFFVNYTMGAPITEPAEFSPDTEATAARTINANRGLLTGPNPRLADTAPPRVSAPCACHSATPPPETPAENPEDQWRQFALNHINQIRAEHGRPPLAMNALLNEIAMAHSKDMAFNIREMSHDGSLGETSPERIKQGKVPDLDRPGQFTYLPYPANIGWAGENVGRRYLSMFGGDVEAAIIHQHEWFMDEPEDQGHNHRTTMLSSLAPFNEIGIGIYRDDTDIIWITEDYISR